MTLRYLYDAHKVATLDSYLGYLYMHICTQSSYPRYLYMHI